MQKNKQNTSDDKKMLLVAGALAIVIMIASYITALAQFSDGKSAISNISSEYVETSSESSSEVVSEAIDHKEYEYYGDFVFESFPYQNSAVVNGSLAVIKDGSNGYPTIDHSKIVNIGNVKTANIYGLANMSLVLYDEAIANIDKFIVSFFEQVPSNGLIINKGYTSSDKIAASDNFVDLVTGYSVQFSIYNSSYKFSDMEFSYLRDQAYRYGVIQRYPEGKESYTNHDSDNTIYRYVGLAHSQYMNRYRYSLEEYLDKIRTEGIIEFKSELEQDTAYVVYYVPLDEDIETTYISLPQGDGYSYSVSGDGENGFIVTVKVSL